MEPVGSHAHSPPTSPGFIPDPSKGIGMNILTIFHYPDQLRVVTCQNLAEAVKALGL